MDAGKTLELQPKQAFLDRPTDTGFHVAAWGERARTRVSVRATEHQLSIVELSCPVGFGPPRHYHREDDEVFLMQSGQLVVWLKDQTLVAHPGDLVFFPRQIEHTWCAVGSVEPVIAVITAPGQFEPWLELATTRRLQRTDTAGLAQAASEAGMDVTGPPLTPEEVQAILDQWVS